MSTHERRTWLVCYDIREPRRLRRVHRLLRRVGATVQYSAFSVVANDEQIDRLLAHLRRTIAEHADDLRAYHLPERCAVWALGCQNLPDGVELDAVGAAAMLLGTAAAATQG